MAIIPGGVSSIPSPAPTLMEAIEVTAKEIDLAISMVVDLEAKLVPVLNLTLGLKKEQAGESANMQAAPHPVPALAALFRLQDNAQYLVRAIRAIHTQSVT